MLVLDAHIARRRAIHTLYTRLLNDLPGIEVKQNPAPDSDSNFWLTCITVDPARFGSTADEIRVHLERENIESRLLWRPMHMQPVFAGCPAYTDGTSEAIFDRGLCLPSGSGLTDADIATVTEEIRKLHKH